MTAVMITPEELNELRKASVAVLDAIKAGSNAMSLAGDLVNALIDIEDRHLSDPDPLIIRWSKTNDSWHTDIDGVGRYSVQRPRKRDPYQAYLNNKDLGLMPDSNPDVLKRTIERRIHAAISISKQL